MLGYHFILVYPLVAHGSTDGVNLDTVIVQTDSFTANIKNLDLDMEYAQTDVFTYEGASGASLFENVLEQTDSFSTGIDATRPFSTILKNKDGFIGWIEGYHTTDRKYKVSET